ncbi:MAG: DUF2786 domain-containing protein [Lysobacter sp.]
MDRQSALRKLHSCLRLGKSNNPHEAANALRQAQKLMTLLDLGESDVFLSDHGTSSAPTRLRNPAIPVHIAGLANLVATTFLCVPMTSWSGQGTVSINVIGPRTGAEIAAYAFTVLRRQLEADASKHVRRLRKAGTKALARDAFSQGWVVAVRALFTPEAMAAEAAEAIDRFIAVNHQGVEPAVPRKSSVSMAKHIGHLAAGYMAGQSARFHRGLQTGSSQPDLLQLADH